jgi:spermidine synthase
MGTKIVEKVVSPINGEMLVIKSLAFGTYIQVDGLTQSGGVVSDVWRTTLKKVKGSHFTKVSRDKKRQEVERCLILGFGGGSAAKLVRKFWPEAEITGVDVDPIIVELGKKYLKFGDEKVKVEIGDAEKVLTYNLKPNTYNLILVDMYVGHNVPLKFETDKFIKLVKSKLSQKGIAVFNRLYYGEKRPLAMKFMEKLENNFKEVYPVYPEANVMFVCKI